MRDLFTEVSLLWSSPSKAGGSKSDLNNLVYWQEGEEDVVEPTGSRVAEDWDRPHRGLKVLSFVAPLCLKDDSRTQGGNNLSKPDPCAFFHFII